MPSPPAATAYAQADSPEVLARVKEGLALVDVIARQLRRQLGAAASEDDLVGPGREALLAAARSFDESRGVPFRRWANLRIRGAMIDSMRSQSHVPRRVYRQLRALEAADRVHEAADEADAANPPKTAHQADERVGERLDHAALAMAASMLSMRGSAAVERAHSTEAPVDEQLARHELLARVRQAIAERPDAERTLLERHYFDDVTFEEAAREIGLSKSWASRLHARAIEGVARALRRSKVGD